MAKQRKELHDILKNILGSNQVYFQPPESIKLTYPCIVYSLDGMSTNEADNNLYEYKKRYSVTLIDKNPDNLIYEKLLRLPLCGFNRFFVYDNLNHYVFDLFF